jgi:pyruvate formate lyase activating enzyme
MNIRGIYKTSLIDFPGKISSVLFTGGCNLRCGFCHNPHLVLEETSEELYTNEEVFEFLHKRIGLIDGVTISGGEPTLSNKLLPFVKKLKDLSLAVKLDTNGSKPQVLHDLLKESLLDYVAIDVKTSPSRYNELTNSVVDFNKIIESIDMLKFAGIDYEIRTTCVPGFVSKVELAEIKDALGTVQNYYLQQFITRVDLLDKSFEQLQPMSVNELRALESYVKTFADYVEIRGI